MSSLGIIIFCIVIAIESILTIIYGAHERKQGWNEGYNAATEDEKDYEVRQDIAEASLEPTFPYHSNIHKEGE